MQADDLTPVGPATAKLKASITTHHPTCPCEVCKRFATRHDAFVAAALTGILASNTAGSIAAHVRMAIRYANEVLDQQRHLGTY